jgi:hypothetical protein
VALVAAVQEASEALHEGASREVAVEERREEGVGLEIGEEEHHEVEVASQAAGELQEEPTSLQEVMVLVEGEVRLRGFQELRFAQGTGQKRPDGHQEALWRSKYPSKGIEVARLGGKLEPLLQVALFIRLPVPVRYVWSLTCLKCAADSFPVLSLCPAKISTCRCEMTSQLIQEMQKQLQDPAMSSTHL